MKVLVQLTMCCLFSLFAAHPASGDALRILSFSNDGPAAEFPENNTVRGQYSSVFNGSPLTVRKTKTRIVGIPGEDYRVKVSVAEQNNAAYLLFVNERDYSFPLYSKGSYIIKTDDISGEIIQIKIFIKTDKGSFIRLFPDGERSRMDLYLYGYPLYRGVLIPERLRTLSAASFSRLVSETAAVVNWDIIFPEKNDAGYATVISMAETIRNFLSLLPDAEDGAMNVDGEFVYIETEEPMRTGGFNCSGFAKWVIDGLYLPVAGSCIELDPLKVKNTDDRGNRWSGRYESVRDPYFGLDWTRNLAAQLKKARYGGEVKSEFADVREVPFFRYTDDVGFEAEHLPIILYLLAIQEPGYFYLASVNDSSTASPNLRQHFHVAAIFPYLTDEGEFRAPVFERNFETSIASFADRYPGGFIHLVRVPGLRNFNPPLVE